MNIIDVRNVFLTLGKTEILKDISVSFECGKIHGLIGRNGSGKTMLMKCICGFVKRDYGRWKAGGQRLRFPAKYGRNNRNARIYPVLFGL